jgi:hypothetical protein
VAFSVEADSTHFFCPAGPHRNVVSSKPTTCVMVISVLIIATTSRTAIAHRASIPCTNPSEGPVPPHRRRSTGRTGHRHMLVDQQIHRQGLEVPP